MDGMIIAEVLMSSSATFWVIIIDSSYLAPHLWIAGVLLVPIHFSSKRKEKKNL
jgi:hypothetical protein